MNDDDITKLAAKLTQSLATKDDIVALKSDISILKTELKADIKNVEKRVIKVEQSLTAEIKSVGKVLTDYMDELDPKIENYENA